MSDTNLGIGSALGVSGDVPATSVHQPAQPEPQPAQTDKPTDGAKRLPLTQRQTREHLANLLP